MRSLSLMHPTPVCNLTPKCPLARTDLRVAKSTYPSSGCCNKAPSTGRLVLDGPHSSVLEPGRLAPSCCCPVRPASWATEGHHLPESSGGGEEACWASFLREQSPLTQALPLWPSQHPSPRFFLPSLWVGMALEGTQMVELEHQLHAQPHLLPLLGVWYRWGCALLDFFLPSSPVL